MDRADLRPARFRATARRRRRLIGVAVVLAAQLAVAVGSEAPASASTINVVYDPSLPGTIDPCSQLVINPETGVTRHLRACAIGIDRTPEAQVIVEAAAAWFADIFEDDHEVTIRWGWLAPAEKLPDGVVLERDETGRPTEGRIRLPSDTDYFYDPTPSADEEFDMRPRLYRTTYAPEQARAFDGSPPEVLEVAYVGRTTVNDLLTEVLHELGHALGLSGGPTVGPGPACDGTNDPYFRPDPDLMGGSTMGIRTVETDKPGEQCVHLELGGITECKTDDNQTVGGDPDVPSAHGDFTLWECASHQGLFWVSELPESRMRPGIVDLLALAEAGGWVEIDLPRKYTAGSGNWDAPSTWIGGGVPDAADDVYIVNQAAGTKVWETPAPGASVANLYISDANALRTVGGPLLVDDEVRVAGPDSAAGPLRLHGSPDEPDADDEVGTATFTRLEVGSLTGGGTVQASHGAVETGGVLHNQNPASVARFGALDNDGVLVGTGTIEASQLTNSGRIRAIGTLVVRTPALDPDDEVAEPVFLDLDGPEAAAELLAVDGFLLVDGVLSDPVRGSIEVGPGSLIAFSEGWQQQQFSDLVLDGTTLPADVYGHSQLDGFVRVDGVGRFRDSLTLSPSAEVRLSIAGTAPGTGHDVLSVDHLAQLGGSLVLDVSEGYQPAPLDTFVVATYGTHAGEFAQILGTELGGGLVLVPDYQDEQLVLQAGFAGAAPGDANCSGAAVSAQVEAHGSVKQAAQFHGVSVKQLQDAIDAYCENQ